MDRTPDGRFAPGNAGGPGRPRGGAIAEHRQALLEAITPADVKAVVQALVDAAKGGDVQAAKVLFDRVFGRVTDTETLERIERLESFLGEQGGVTPEQWWEGMQAAQDRSN